MVKELMQDSIKSEIATKGKSQISLYLTKDEVIHLAMALSGNISIPLVIISQFLLIDNNKSENSR